MRMPPLFDCDIHHSWRSEDDVRQYLPQRWRDTLPAI